MNLKIVYSLICSDRNYCLEQLQLSIYSLRKYNSSADIVVVCDNDSERFIASRLTDGNIELVSVSCPSDMSPAQKSRYLKTNLRNIIDGDFLYIDNDTVILESLDEIDSIPYDFAAVPDWTRFNSQWLAYILTTRKRLKKPNATFFNSGVMLVRDTPKTRLLFSKWSEYWRKSASEGLYMDQLPLSIALSDRKLSRIAHELPGEWNCQVMRDEARKYEKTAKIIHYQTSLDNIKPDIDLIPAFQHIRETNDVPFELKNLIDNKTIRQLGYTVTSTGYNETYLTSPLYVLMQYNIKLFHTLENLSGSYISLTLSPMWKALTKIIRKLKR